MYSKKYFKETVDITEGRRKSKRGKYEGMSAPTTKRYRTIFSSKMKRKLKNPNVNKINGGRWVCIEKRECVRENEARPAKLTVMVGARIQDCRRK